MTEQEQQWAKAFEGKDEKAIWGVQSPPGLATEQIVRFKILKQKLALAARAKEQAPAPKPAPSPAGTQVAPISESGRKSQSQPESQDK